METIAVLRGLSDKSGYFGLPLWIAYLLLRTDELAYVVIEIYIIEIYTIYTIYTLRSDLV
jgi:hypothetical protein